MLTQLKMKIRGSVSLFLFLMCMMATTRITGTRAFLQHHQQSPISIISRRRQRQRPSRTAVHTSKQPTSRSERIREKLENLFAGENTFEKRQRIREEYEELEDADFLLADVKPKLLVHERDYFRQSTRIQAWDEYVLVSILCTSISYGALQTFQLNPDHEGIFLYESVLKTMIQVVAGMAVLNGLYSTMVFSLSILYGRTALGLERDEQYDVFLDKTQDIRDAAFKAFSISLALFAILVVLVLSEDLPLLMHLPIGGVMLGALYVGFRDWKILVDYATDIYDYLDLDDD
jgi:hypothetical protein